MLDHGHDEAPVERHRDADVDVGAVDRAVARNRCIDDRVLPQILGAGFGDEREEGEIHATLGIGLLRLAAELRDAGEIDLKEARDVRGDPPRRHHVIRGDLANLGPRLDAVAGPRFDGGVLDGTRAWGLGPGDWGRRGTFDVAKDVLLRYTPRITAARD